MSRPTYITSGPAYPFPDIEVEYATEEEVLEFANSVRKAGGGDILEALLPSIVGNAGYCLLATALNFKCSVGPSGPKTSDNIVIVSRVDKKGNYRIDTEWAGC